MSTTVPSKLGAALQESPASSAMKVFSESSFFKEKRARALPAPADIRAINEKSGKRGSQSLDCPPPVILPSLGLVVKYGIDVTVAEAETQIMLKEQLRGRVPVPEVFGWAKDGKQTFVYMSLIEGETLAARWGDLSHDEKAAICGELRHLLKMLRALKQDPNDQYIGSLGKRPLNDIFLERHSDLNRPFQGANAVGQFQDACGIEIASESPIVFTHNDLLPPNIILTLGPNPRVAAIVDWNQSGWYPAYWEYCKARWIKVNPTYFCDAFQEEWRGKYLPMILDPVDEETCYHPWLYFVLTRGI